MLDRAIIDHASPTLARLKLANLFNYPITEGFHSEFIALQEELRKKSVTLSILRVAQGKALIYVYRADALVNVLRDSSVQQFLMSCGYHRFDAIGAIETLKARLDGADAFPHEIGIFLGYPLEDVLGFIENGGRNCLTCGCWKVYSNESAALTAFQRYSKCKAVYQRLFASGCPLSRLTVATRPA